MEEEKQPSLRPFTEKSRQELFAKDLPLTHQDDRCPTEDYFIQEYKDGRIHLVHFDIYSRKFTLVKALTQAFRK